MECWQTALSVVFILSVLSLPDADAKKKKKPKWPLQEDTLREQCKEKNDGSRHGGSRKKVNILELQALLYLTEGFACLKMETCSRHPICIVEDTGDLKRNNLSDCALWTQLFRRLKTNRKMEPVFDGQLSNRNTGKTRRDNSWNEAVSTLCHNASVYRFVSGDRDEKSNSTSAVENDWSSGATNAPDVGTMSPDSKSSEVNSTVPSTGTQLNRNRDRRGGNSKRLLKRIEKRTLGNIDASNNITSSFPHCHGLNDGCTRICVGQNEKAKDVPDCATFRIHCTILRAFKRPSRKKNKNRNRRKESRSDK